MQRFCSGPPIRGQVIRRGASGFLQAAHVYNERFDSESPLAVARPNGAADVQAAVRWAVGHGVPLRARSGGHSYAGYSTCNGGLVIDLSPMRFVRVDPFAKTARVAGGAWNRDRPEVGGARA